MLLQVQNLYAYYDESCICNGLSLNVDRGESVCLLGRNGVGKTTLMKSIMGLLPHPRGEVEFAGKSISGLKPYEVARRGIGYVPQGRIIFPSLTVAENLRLGMSARRTKGKLAPDIVFRYFPILKERLKQKGGTLSGGEQQMLAVGRALSLDPMLVLLDEPSEGLSAFATQELIAILKQMVAETEMSVLMVEQNLEMALDMCTRGYVMEKGCIVAEGTTSRLENDEVVRSHLMV
jgi:urea ABC transporter ATP-binding protein UrtE